MKPLEARLAAEIKAAGEMADIETDANVAILLRQADAERQLALNEKRHDYRYGLERKASDRVLEAIRMLSLHEQRSARLRERLSDFVIPPAKTRSRMEFLDG